VKSKIEKEKHIIDQMILIYCKSHRHTSFPLCEKCGELKKYAHKRLNNCRFGEDKGFCSNCPIHCYKPDMRAKIKKVMKYSGPRMLFKNPTAVIKHIIESLKQYSFLK